MQLYPLYDTLVDYDFDSLEARPGLATAWELHYADHDGHGPAFRHHVPWTAPSSTPMR